MVEVHLFGGMQVHGVAGAAGPGEGLVAEPVVFDSAPDRDSVAPFVAPAGPQPAPRTQSPSVANPARPSQSSPTPKPLIYMALDLDLHLVLDNYANCKTPAIHQWLLKHPRFHLHFTPTSSSWLNLIERWLAELTNRKLRRSAHRSVTELEDDIRKWINEWNKVPKPFVFTKSAGDILETVAEYCQQITNSGH